MENVSKLKCQCARLTMGLSLFCLLSPSFSQQSSSYNANSVPGFNGTTNTGFGFGVMAGFFSGAPGNTGIGNFALFSNNGGEFNTAIGNNAMEYNGTGSSNVASGSGALRFNTSSNTGGGSFNTATGYAALYQNDVGSNNTATGTEALYFNTVGSSNTADGYRALRYNMGTNGDFGEKNTAFGFASLYANYNGDENTGLGHGALYTNSDGIRNTAAGAYSMLFPFNPTGIMNQDNSAIGYGALCGYFTTNNESKNNCAAGYYSLFSCSDGDDNVAVGYYSSYNTYDGYNNVTIGKEAGKNMQGAWENVACGAFASRDYVGTFGGGGMNTAIGGGALQMNAAGEENVAIGHSALWSQVGTKNGNTAVGYYADLNGYYKNATAFGNLAVVTGDDRMRIGNNSITNIDCAVNYTGISDGRFKYNVNDKGVVGLRFINALRPTAYDVDLRKLEEFQTRNMPEESRRAHMTQDFDALLKRRNSGFLAQEVEKAALACGYDFDGVVKPANEYDNYNLMYGLFVVPLTKAVQEQQVLIEEQRKRNDELQKVSEQASARIAQMRAEYSGAAVEQPASFATEQLEVSLPAGVKSARFSLYDLSGAELLSSIVDVNGPLVSLDGRQPGIYVYSVHADGTLLSSRTIVIK